MTRDLRSMQVSNCITVLTAAPEKCFGSQMRGRKNTEASAWKTHVHAGCRRAVSRGTRAFFGSLSVNRA